MLYHFFKMVETDVPTGRNFKSLVILVNISTGTSSTIQTLLSPFGPAGIHNDREFLLLSVSSRQKIRRDFERGKGGHLYQTHYLL